jgi:anaerobic selenocysteine-containing dehydrogenase
LERTQILFDAALASGQASLLDRDFLAQHTSGFAAFEQDLRAQHWAPLLEEAGVARAQIDQLAELYSRSRNVISTWGMGLTQHVAGVQNVQMLVNLQLLRGNIGKPGANICPVRGHSNVQGQRTVGITEKPELAPRDKLKGPPAAH